jgi:predicted Ser/Thr protein kinase
MAGSLIGLLPIVASLCIGLARKVTGNRYNMATITAFGLTGLFFAFLMPWLLAIGASEVFRGVFRGASDLGLTASDVATLKQESCFGEQRDYLGGGATVYEVLFHPFEGALKLVLHVTGLVVVPLLCLLFVMLQARAAMRRGPKWPARLVWVPFVVMIVLTAPMAARVAIYLWMGFLPVAVLGIIPVLILGPPSWSVIERSNQRPQPPPPPYEPPPPPPPYEPPPVREPAPDRAALAKLAADPGPLPFARKDPTPSMWQRTGGRFRKIRPLGAGGFGTVWLAMDTQLNRTVAVKMAHAPDAETEERMLREARALAAVRHPNCVRVYDIVSDTDGLGMVMEYIEGQPLADAVAEVGPLGDVAAARLWMTMAGALSAAHAKGVLHRDVKPANVIIDPEGNPHLIDFGIARSKGDSTLTATGMMVGTPDFLAPETAAGAPATPASDAWQLAATVSFALTGAPPRGVRENAMAALLAAAKTEPLTQLPQRSAHRRLLVASLDPDPNRRPTLAAVAREMSGWLARAGQAQDGPVTKVVDVNTTRPMR